MSILKELSQYTPPQVNEDRLDSAYEALMESIEELYEADEATPQRPGRLSLSKASVVMISPSDSGFDVKDKVFGIRNDNAIVAFMLDILGVPKDGSAIRIRTGFMKYDGAHKTLFIARFKSDLPGEKK